MKRIFKQYAELLAERLAQHSRTKEDEARYTFFHAVLYAGEYEHTDVTLEISNPGLAEGAEIDTIPKPRGGQSAAALEFKLDQLPPCGRAAKTNKAGAVFNDLNRLAQVKFDQPTKIFFVHITDSAMDRYFQKNPGLADFYARDGSRKKIKVTKNFWKKRMKSILDKVTAPHVEFSVSLIFLTDLPKEFSFRIFGVKSS